MPYYIVILLIFMSCFVSFSSASYAEESSFGLAMHGQPKYSIEDTHLSYANPDAPKGGTLKQSALGTFDSFNPYAIKGTAAQGLNLFYDRLMQRVWDEPFTLYPLIAESVNVPDDRSSITFTLNPKARFHDGSQITADDVVFSFETLRDFGRPNQRKVYQLVTDIVQPDARTVTFTLGEGHDRETVMILAMMPVLSKAWWQGRDFDSSVLDIPVSNGPYKIEAFEPGRQIIYARDPNYWAADHLTSVGHYNFDRVVYDYFRDDTVALQSFLAGDLDVRREQDAALWNSGYDTQGVIQQNFNHGRPERVRAFIMNSRRPPFDDLRVRKALNYLFDFQWVNDNLYFGDYQRISSFYPNSELAAEGAPSEREVELLSPWRDDLSSAVFVTAWTAPTAKDRGALRENLRKANALLEDAGWLITDGKRQKDGIPFQFEILLGAKEDEKVALHFQQALKRAGIDITLRVMDRAAYQGRLNEYDFDMTLYFWLSSLSPGTEQILYWGCEAAEQPARWNFPGICNPAIDSLAGEIAQTQDRDDLVAHVRALDRILTHGTYIIPLGYAGYDRLAYWPQVSYPDETPVYGPVLETWWMEPEKQ